LSWWGGSTRFDDDDVKRLCLRREDYGVRAAVQGAELGTALRPTDTDVTLINYEGEPLDGATFDKSQQSTPMPVAPFRRPEADEQGH
jgi:hypothetical protein